MRLEGFVQPGVTAPFNELTLFRSSPSFVIMRRSANRRLREMSITALLSNRGAKPSLTWRMRRLSTRCLFNAFVDMLLSTTCISMPRHGIVCRDRVQCKRDASCGYALNRHSRFVELYIEIVPIGFRSVVDLCERVFAAAIGRVIGRSRSEMHFVAAPHQYRAFC
jgi:hypothetical protein